MKPNLIRLCLVAGVLATFLATASVAHADKGNDNDKRKIKVMIVTFFDFAGDPSFPGEATFWKIRDNLNQRVRVKGLASQYPDVMCNEKDECLITTDTGYANAASSIMALVLSDKFDLSQTYFLIAGIAGIDPACGTLGTPAWARFALDGGLSYELDAREMPAGWSTGYFALGSTEPGQPPAPTSYVSTQVFRLNERLLDKAFNLAKNVELADSPEAQSYRSLYPDAPANKPPKMTKGDNLSYDVYWYGKLMADRAILWTKVLSNGAGNFCTTSQEDTAVLTALKRGADAKFVDFSRVAVLRAGAGFDQPYPGRSAYDGLVNEGQGGFGGYFPSIENLYRVGEPLVKFIIKNWDGWKYGVQ